MVVSSSHRGYQYYYSSIFGCGVVVLWHFCWCGPLPGRVALHRILGGFLYIPFEVL